MSDCRLRFIHTADFWLHEPIGGLAEVPPHLREAVFEAPWWSAERVFEATIAESADFLVISGGVLATLRTGPRGLLFLAEQFARLHEHRIPVYWAGTRHESPDRWPKEIKLPDSVIRFPAGRPQPVQYRREGVPVACLVGASRSAGSRLKARDFVPDPGGLFSIAVFYGWVKAQSLQAVGIDYWALGGRRGRDTLFSSPGVAHYPGSPQGRQPRDAGPHGCTLVRVDDQRQVQTTFLPCDVLRWHVERVRIERGTDRQALAERLRDRAQNLRQAHPGIELLVRWELVGEGPLAAEARKGRLATELLDMLRDEFGRASPALWSVGIEVEPPELFAPEWYEQETIRGDFLRQLRTWQTDPSRPLPLDLPAADCPPAGLDGLKEPWPAAVREAVLRRAAQLGVDLLSGKGQGP